jgi:hypothetical protein
VRHQIQLKKIEIKKEPVRNSGIVIGHNTYTAVVKEFVPLPPEEVKSNYIQEVIELTELGYDGKLIDIADAMKAGGLIKADIISALDEHRSSVEACLDSALTL